MSLLFLGSQGELSKTLFVELSPGSSISSADHIHEHHLLSKPKAAHRNGNRQTSDKKKQHGPLASGSLGQLITVPTCLQHATEQGQEDRPP
jgi:hypothetical protein